MYVTVSFCLFFVLFSCQMSIFVQCSHFIPPENIGLSNLKQSTHSHLLSKQEESFFLKVGLSPFKKVGFICFKISPLKMMKNLFMLKALFVLIYLTFCHDFCDHLGKRLHKKTKVNFKIFDVTDWETNNYCVEL